MQSRDVGVELRLAQVGTLREIVQVLTAGERLDALQKAGQRSDLGPLYGGTTQPRLRSGDR